MKVAIYARYSTNQQDQTSITGQVTNCVELAKDNGWRVVEHYSDEAISGTDDSRPAYQQLLADSEAGKFDAIIVDETSRLTRRPGELPRLLEIFAFRNQFLIDCKGFDSRQETASLLASIYGGIDSLELRKIKERTHRGLRERAKAGFSAGGKCYGYETEIVDPDDPQSKKRHVVIEHQQTRSNYSQRVQTCENRSPRPGGCRRSQGCAELAGRVQRAWRVALAWLSATAGCCT